MERSFWESVATVQWIVQTKESFRPSTFGLGGTHLMVLYFFEAIKADKGYGGLTGPSDDISNMKSQWISTEEGYGGLICPSDGISRKKRCYQVRRDKVV